jgi:protein SCO1/2
MSARREAAALAALAFLGGVTSLWWALALWPSEDEWLLRARFVCFNVGASGLPDAAGWLLLVGQPIGMFAALMAISGPALRAGLARLAGFAWGKAVLGACGLALVLGLAAAGARVTSTRDDAGAFAAQAMTAQTYPRLDRNAPALGLLDQRGERLDLARLAGRPALVTFAFAHCEAVCPAVVRQTLDAQRIVRERVGDAHAPSVVVVTLDPWRDTPSRLPALATDFSLAEDGFVLSGPVDEVNALLDRWKVARGRDPRTGDVAHPPLVYVLDAEGRIAFASTGGAEVLVELLGRI